MIAAEISERDIQVLAAGADGFYCNRWLRRERGHQPEWPYKDPAADCPDFIRASGKDKIRTFLVLRSSLVMTAGNQRVFVWAGAGGKGSGSWGRHSISISSGKRKEA